MRVLDLFAGIGGFSLAAHWMGWETAAFVEWEDFPQRVLKKNFPGVPVYGDIREFDGHKFIKEHGPVDIVCGGFPCQPFSTAGKRKGREDNRYLWPEMLRVIRETQPSFVVGENVAGLISMDGGLVLEQVCADLESEGYAVQPFIIPAIAVGAPHRRDRIWIVARARSSNSRGTSRQLQMDQPCCTSEIHGPTQSSQQFAKDSERGGLRSGKDETRNRREEQRQFKPTDEVWSGGVCSQRPSCHSKCEGLEGCVWIQRAEGLVEGHNVVGVPNNAGLEGRGQYGERTDERSVGSPDWKRHWYEVAFATCYDGVDDGIPVELDQYGNRDNRAKRLKALGNAIVPQVAYEVFRAIQNEMQ